MSSKKQQTSAFSISAPASRPRVNPFSRRLKLLPSVLRARSTSRLWCKALLPNKYPSFEKKHKLFASYITGFERFEKNSVFIAVVIRELERKSVQMFSSWLIPSARAR